MGMNAYITYDGKVRIDSYEIIVSMWNAYAEGGNKSKVYLNNSDFFEKNFKNKYDAAWAVSIGDWRWTDDFVYFNEDGHLTSFSRCEDNTCPIEMDKIDIGYLIRALQDIEKDHKKEHKKEYDNNISRAIHDALE